MSKKLIGTLISIVLVVIFGILIYCFWPSIKAMILGQKYYSAKEMEESFNKGFASGNKSEKELTSQVTFYKNLIDDCNTSIDALNKKINNLNAEILALKINCGNFSIEIENLNNEKLSLEATCEQLEATIADYRAIIDNYAGDGVLVTFMYNDFVYSVRNIERNGIVNINNPADTNNIKFNGWKINGEIVDINQYLFSESTTVWADVTYYHTVNYVLDNEIYDTRYVQDNTFAENLIVDEEVGFVFNGWSVNGVDVIDLSSFEITQNTTLVAVIEKTIYEVTFIHNNQVYLKSTVRHGETLNTTITDPFVLPGYFGGWCFSPNSYKQSAIDLNNYIFTENTTLYSISCYGSTDDGNYNDLVYATINCEDTYDGNTRICIDFENYHLSPSFSSIHYELYTGGTLFHYNLNTFFSLEIGEDRDYIQFTVSNDSKILNYIGKRVRICVSRTNIY